MCLSWWTIPSVRVHLDVRTGRGHFALWPCRHGIQGRAWRVKGTWYALHADPREHGGHGVVFRAGKETWPIEELKADVTPRGNRRLFAFEVNQQRITVEYDSPADELWARADVTYDGLDEELDDFFVMVSRVARDREVRTALARRWASEGPREEGRHE